MNEVMAIVARLAVASERIMSKKWSFLVLFAIAFVSSLTILAELDLLPEAAKAEVAATPAAVVEAPAVATTTVSVVEEPIQIEIPVIGVAATIANPMTTNIPALDKLLLQGAVRYPTSAKLGEKGNVVLFGHSSYLPIVNNKAFKTFNDIQKLAAGDLVTVYSAHTAYTYAVRTVAKESTTNAAIALNVDGQVLTLSTCNSFGATTDRFVVTADFVESHSISS